MSTLQDKLAAMIERNAEKEYPERKVYSQDDKHVMEAFRRAYLAGGESLAPLLLAAVDVLSELADLMEDTVAGEYKPDSFTTQPARRFLTLIDNAVAGGKE